MSVEAVWKHHLRLQEATSAWERDSPTWLPPHVPARPFLNDFEDECERQSVLALVSAAEFSILDGCNAWIAAPSCARDRELANLYSKAAAGPAACPTSATFWTCCTITVIPTRSTL